MHITDACVSEDLLCKRTDTIYTACFADFAKNQMQKRAQRQKMFDFIFLS